MERRPGKYAVIFDMDGVLSDTQSLHSSIESEVLGAHGIVIEPKTIAARYSGVSDLAMFSELLAGHPEMGVSAEELSKQKWHQMELQIRGGIQAMPHVGALLHVLNAAGLRLAVASGSPCQFIETVLGEINFRHFFEVAVSSEEVPHGKPAPDVFLEVAKRLDISPSRCVVVEDGESGMVAAKAAGMACVGLVADTALECCADMKVTALNQINAAVISSLLAKYE